MKKIILIVLIPVIMIISLLSLRLFIGGSEDTWICQDGSWVKHGNPTNPMPTAQCGTKTTLIFFSNSKLSTNMNECNEVFPVERLSETGEDAYARLRKLFVGPTQEELDNGYTSPFSNKTANILKRVKLIGSVAYVDLVDIRNITPNVSASCGSAQFLSQVEQTLKVDPKISKIIFAIDGDPATFYDWIQIGCTKDNDNCNKIPFN